MARRMSTVNRRRLTAHFSLSEFDCHDGTPVPEASTRALRMFCHVYLEPLRAIFGPVVILSGYRTKTYNRRIGGVPGSYHIYDEHPGTSCADLACRTGRPSDWARELERLGAAGVGIYGGYVHVDNRAGESHWMG
jgi:uncharacterized protein YcbK (DUF882 family)